MASEGNPKGAKLREEAIEAAAFSARQTALGGIVQATNLADFISHYIALKFINHGAIKDLWDNRQFQLVPNDPTDITLFLYHPEIMARMEEDAHAIDEMLPRFVDSPEEPGQVALTLKRIRDSHGRYRYGVLARFPQGEHASSAFPQEIQASDATSEIVYFAPETPCASHAADDLFKLYRDQPFQVPFRTKEAAIGKLLALDSGMAHYVVDRTSDQTLKQDAANYLLVGLHEGYSNEFYVAPISRFKAANSV